MATGFPEGRHALVKRFVTVLVLISVCAVLVGGAGSLRRPGSMIEGSLLRMAPLGSSPAEVLQAIEQKRWTHGAVRGVGFVKQESNRRMEIVGTKSVDAHLGDYGIFLKTSVDACWGFDADGKLIAVWVWKTTDAP